MKPSSDNRISDHAAVSTNVDRRSISRRRMVIGGAAGLIALGTGMFALERSRSRRADWIEHVVRSNLPGIHVDEASLSTFVGEILESDLFESKRYRLSMFADGTAPGLARRFPQLRDDLDRLERLVLSEFLLGSNFFRVEDPRTALITYHGRLPACGNPFAVFT